MKVLAPGLLTTVQDLGRVGFAKQGVSPSGAMDGNALRAANLLVGNPENAACLEITSGGVHMEFRKRALIAISGADLSAAISGLALPSWRAIYVQDGSVVEFGDARRGWRAYFVVAGGIDVSKVMGSRSTAEGGVIRRPWRSWRSLRCSRSAFARARTPKRDRRARDVGFAPKSRTAAVRTHGSRLGRSGTALPIRIHPICSGAPLGHVG